MGGGGGGGGDWGWGRHSPFYILQLPINRPVAALLVVVVVVEVVVVALVMELAPANPGRSFT